jgi:hypothetical protein
MRPQSKIWRHLAPRASRLALALLLLSLLTSHLSPLFAQGTAFTYQGRLTDNGAPFTGVVELDATLWDADTNGNQVIIGPRPPAPVMVEVTNGLFTVELDFRKGVFTGARRWLQISLRKDPDPAPFTTLWPRQRITATPYAVTAGELTGAVPSDGLIGGYGNIVAFDNPGNFFAGQGSDLIDLNASELTSGTVPSEALGNAWKTGGNTGTTPGTHFLGTTDNQPLELRVNGMRGLRLQPVAGNDAVSVVGGSARNSVSFGVLGATIAGGGTTNYFGSSGAYSNAISGHWSTIGGGMGNNIRGIQGTIGGGFVNTIQSVADGATIAGGLENTIQSFAVGAIIGGGIQNNIQTNSRYGTIGGGFANWILAGATHGTIGGGNLNLIQSDSQYGTVPGGQQNLATTLAFAAGFRAKASHAGSFVWADSTPADFSSTATNQFAVRAAGGARFVTGGAGMTLDGQPVLSGTVTTAQLADGAVLGELLDDDGADSGLDADLLDGLNSTAFALAAHTHSGADIISGTVPDARIAATIARDSEVLPIVLAGDGSGSGLDADLLDGLSSAAFWQLGGNAGTTAGTHFLGTTDNQPLEFKVNGLRAMRLELGGDSFDPGILPDGAPNVILGAPVNFVAAGEVGATIAGGGASDYDGSPRTNSILSSYGAILGGMANRIAPGAGWSSIAGGLNNDVGTNSNVGAIGGGNNNNIAANSDYGTIAGGLNNDIGTNSDYGVISGGLNNNITANSHYSIIAGGALNDIGNNSANSVIGGGTNNNIAANSSYTTIAGGHLNGVGTNSPGSAIGGGTNNIIAANSANSTIAGGQDNDISTNSFGSVIGGGYYNSIGTNSASSVIGGGQLNRISDNSRWSVIAGGNINRIYDDSPMATIAGGYFNYIDTNSDYSVIGGGVDNAIAANTLHATIGGGRENDIGAHSTGSAIGGGTNNNIAANSSHATIAGGAFNDLGTNSPYSTIGGGNNNNIAANASYSTIAGGIRNDISTNSSYSAIGGGFDNDIGTNSLYSAIGGGFDNDIGANSAGSTIAGGSANSVAANADYATIPGGAENEANGNYSFAAGRRAKATLPGTFVWADSQAADFAGGITDSVSFRCQGGVRFTSGSGGANQTVSWLPGFVSWSFSSDRNLKEGLTDVNTREVLDKVSRLPMSEWNFKGHSQRHIGPMAQDFHALFPLNENDKMIDSGDLQGVALAAIQGLNEKVEVRSERVEGVIRELREELRRRSLENEELKRELAGLKNQMDSIHRQLNGGTR